MHSPSFSPLPNLGYHISGKEVEVPDSGSRHHQLCGCCNLQLIQSRMAPSHSPPVRILSPLFFPAKSLLLPKPHGKKKHSKTTWSSFLSSKTAWSSLFSSPKLHESLPSPPKPHGPLFSFRTTWSSLWPPRHRDKSHKSQCPSSSAAPFPTPPTISYTCQHSHILPALLGCHSKSGQVWPQGMEPIISKLSRRHCNQRELLPSYILGGIHLHPPCSKHGHRHLTNL